MDRLYNVVIADIARVQLDCVRCTGSLLEFS